MNKEYVIWGIPPNGNEEVLLLTKTNNGNITKRSDAEFYVGILESSNCTDVRIQEIDFSTDPDFTRAIK